MGAYHSCNTFSQPIAHYSLLMVKSDRVTYSSSLKGSSHSLPISPFQTLPLFLFLSISLALSGHNVSCLFAVISAGWINVLSGLFRRQRAGSFPDPWLISYSPAAEVSSLLASEPVSGQRKGKWERRCTLGGFPTHPFNYLFADRPRKVMMDDALSKSDNIFSPSQSCGLLSVRLRELKTFGCSSCNRLNMIIWINQDILLKQ